MRSGRVLRGIQATQELVFWNPLGLSVRPGRSEAPGGMFFQELHALARLLALLPGFLPGTAGVVLRCRLFPVGRFGLFEEAARIAGCGVSAAFRAGGFSGRRCRRYACPDGFVGARGGGNLAEMDVSAAVRPAIDPGVGPGAMRREQGARREQDQRAPVTLRAGRALSPGPAHALRTA